jgi:septum site-determining protein MinC
MMEVFMVETLVIKNTIRGGKNIEHFGDIIVLGDVYPGTEVRAGGNIVVMGCAQGTLIAGTVTGDAAIITVGRFQCPHIKIGKFSARQETINPRGAEYLAVEKGQLISKVIKTQS